MVPTMVVAVRPSPCPTVDPIIPPNVAPSHGSMDGLESSATATATDESTSNDIQRALTDVGVRRRPDINAAPFLSANATSLRDRRETRLAQR